MASLTMMVAGVFCLEAIGGEPGHGAFPHLSRDVCPTGVPGSAGARSAESERHRTQQG